MTRLAAIVLCAVLAACTPTQLAVHATHTSLPPEQAARLASICRAAEPALVIAMRPSMPETVRDIGGYAAAYCGQLLAGRLPETTDRDTPRWLSLTLQGLTIAAHVAGVALPL